MAARAKPKIGCKKGERVKITYNPISHDNVNNFARSNYRGWELFYPNNWYPIDKHYPIEKTRKAYHMLQRFWKELVLRNPLFHCKWDPTFGNGLYSSRTDLDIDDLNSIPGFGFLEYIDERTAKFIIDATAYRSMIQISGDYYLVYGPISMLNHHPDSLLQFYDFRVDDQYSTLWYEVKMYDDQDRPDKDKVSVETTPINFNSQDAIEGRCYYHGLRLLQRNHKRKWDGSLSDGIFNFNKGDQIVVNYGRDDINF
jgi:hypothetical protein